MHSAASAALAATIAADRHALAARRRLLRAGNRRLLRRPSRRRGAPGPLPRVRAA